MKLIVDYLPAGAVAPNGDAETDFEIKMLTDAVNYHQNGDGSAPPCCTATDPCRIRADLVDRIRRIRPSVHTDLPDPRAEVHGSGAGSQVRQVADPASEKQISFIRKLAEEKDTADLTAPARRTLAEIRDGSAASKKRASSLINALIKAPRSTDPAEVRISAGPSQAQISLIRQLCAEQSRQTPADLTRGSGSSLITELLRSRTSQAGSGSESRISADLQDGMYRTADGEIYKVQRAVHGSGRIYAKKLAALADPRQLKNGIRTHEFRYEAGSLRKLTAEMAMTLEEARTWGALYGSCCRCGLTLTDEKSIADGIGPFCAKKF